MISEIRAHPVRFVKNCGLFSCFLTIGLSLGVVGPTLLDFASKTKSDLKLVALILPFRAGGYAAGSFVAGLLYNKLDVQILTAAVMAISGVFTIAIPFIYDIWVLLCLFLVVGTCLGLFSAGKSQPLIDHSTHSLLLSLLSRKHVGPRSLGKRFVHCLSLYSLETHLQMHPSPENPPFMQALHFMYGVGKFMTHVINSHLHSPCSRAFCRRVCCTSPRSTLPSVPWIHRKW